MRFGFNIITNFLWETYGIDRGTYLRKKILAASDEEKALINNHQVLNNLFLLRRIRDPGFYIYITKEVKKDTATFTHINNYVKKLILTYCYDVDFDTMEVFPSNQQEIYDIDENLVHGFDMQNFSHEKEIEVALKYLKARYEIASEIGDEDEIVAIAHNVSDYTTGKDHSHYLFNIQSLYKNLDSTRDIIISQNRRYVVENIRNENFYDIEKSSSQKNESSLIDKFNSTLLLDSDFILKIINVVDENFGKSKSSSIDEILKYSKFVSDFISIASYVWFNSHLEDEKIKILNGNYKFSISDSLLTEYMKTEVCKNDKENVCFSLFSEALSFYNENYLEEAESIWSFVETRTDNVWLKYFCLSNLATVSREKLNYRKALENYKRSFDLLSSLDETSANKELKFYRKNYPKASIKYPAYHQAIDLKNMGEMYHQLREHEKGDKCLYQAEQFRGINNEDKIIIYWNIANAHRRVFDFKSECLYLIKILDFRSNKFSEIKAEAHLRLNVLNDPEFILPDGSFDSQKLSMIDKKEKQQIYYEKARCFSQSFQFERSIECLDNALKINDDKKFHLAKAFAYFSLGNLDAAKQSIQMISEDEDEISKIIYNSLMGIVKVYEGKTEEGIEKMEESVRLGFTPRALETAYKTYGNLNDWISGYLLSPYIRNILPLKDQKLTYKVFDRLECTLDIFEKEASSSELIGNLFMEYGFLGEAKRYFERGLNMKGLPKEFRAELYHKRGIVNSINTNYEEALKDFDKSLSITNSSITWESRAEVYSSLFDFKNAMSCIKEAKKTRSREP